MMIQSLLFFTLTKTILFKKTRKCLLHVYISLSQQRCLPLAKAVRASLVTVAKYLECDPECGRVKVAHECEEDKASRSDHSGEGQPQ